MELEGSEPQQNFYYIDKRVNKESLQEKLRNQMDL
jgi:hypothetical protein